jgi:hypothetical protein
VPFGPPGVWGGDFGLYGIDVSIGLLYFFAFGSLAFYGLMLGGWASGSPYPLLGGMRPEALPPGRGWLITRSEGRQLVQLAHHPPAL